MTLFVPTGPLRVNNTIVLKQSESLLLVTAGTRAPISAAVAATVTIVDVVTHSGIVCGFLGVERRVTSSLRQDSAPTK